MTKQVILADLGLRHALVPATIVGLALAAVTGMVGVDTLWARLAVALMVFVLVVACAAPVAVLAVMGHRRTGLIAVGIVAGLFLVNLVSLSLPSVGLFAELEWNWQGKTLDLFWCLALIALLSPDTRREIGWTWRANPGTLLPAFINIAILALIGFFVFGVATPGDVERRALSLERVLFDVSYPNLAEEIVFRGFMLAMLDRAFPPRWTFGGAKVGWGVVLTGWLFGLAHGISVGPEGGIVFDSLWLIMTFAAGLVLGWIRALTGSLWPAFLAHCAPEIGILVALALD